MLFSSITAFAQSFDELMIEPVQTTAGKAVTAYILLNNPSTANEVKNMQFDIQWPEGWTVAKVTITAAKVNSRFSRTEMVYDEDLDEDVEKSVPYFNASSIINANNLATYTYYSIDNTPLKGSTGYIGSVRVTPPAGTPDGIYPIYLKAGETFVATSSKVEDRHDFSDATSYIVVGNPLAQNLSLTGTIPSFVNSALAEQTGIEALNLTEVTASNGTFTYVDGRNVFGPSTEVKGNVVYKRAAGTSTYSSLKLPFAADVNCLKFVNVENNTANFTAATTVAANESVIVEGAVDVQAENVVLGTATEGKANDGQFYLKNDKFYSVNVTAVVPAFRGLWDMPASASNLRIAVDGVLTGIDATQIDAQSNAFDLQGRQVQNTKNGVFVVNGKKQFVK